jgi:ferredoxin
MDVHVDSEKCQGHARCYAICPEVFQLDEEGFASTPIPTVPKELEKAAKEAVENCPERAISITETIAVVP